MASLRDGILKSGVGFPFHARKGGGVQICPSSLLQLAEGLSATSLERNALVEVYIHHRHHENFQGITHASDASVFYVSCGNGIEKYRIDDHGTIPADGRRRSLAGCVLVSINRSEIAKQIETVEPGFSLSALTQPHISDLSYANGVIFAIVKGRHDTGPHLLLGLSEDLDVIGYHVFPARETLPLRDMSCAWNASVERLYVEGGGEDEDVLRAFSVDSFFSRLERRSEWGRRVDATHDSERDLRLTTEAGVPCRIGWEGFVFARSGRLYATETSADHLGEAIVMYHNRIEVFNWLTGRRIDRGAEKDFPGTGDEIEGLSIHPNGKMMYIVVCDNNDPFVKDTLRVYAFCLPGDELL